MSTTKSTVYCYDRFATHKRLGAALMLALGAGALWSVSSTASAATERKVETLPRVVVTGKSVKPAARRLVAQLPRVVVEGRRVQEPVVAMNRAGFETAAYVFTPPAAGF